MSGSRLNHSDFRGGERAWLLVLLEGDERARPRSHSTLSAVLHALTGHLLAGTFTSLRSLFQFAKRRRLIFADPTRRLSAGQAPRRAFLPMTDEQIAAVKDVAVTPGQRLVIALAAVYAARAKAIRELTVDDIDLARRRITIGGHRQHLTEFAHRTLVACLRYRHRRWPHTPNRHVLVSAQSALGTAPITDYYLTWHLLLPHRARPDTAGRLRVGRLRRLEHRDTPLTGRTLAAGSAGAGWVPGHARLVAVAQARSHSLAPASISGGVVRLTSAIRSAMVTLRSDSRQTRSAESIVRAIGQGVSHRSAGTAIGPR